MDQIAQYQFDQLVEARLLLAEIEGSMEARKKWGELLESEHALLAKMTAFRKLTLYPPREEKNG